MEPDKQTLTEDLLQSVRQRFPDLRQKSYVLPIMRFNSPTYKSIQGLSFPPLAPSGNSQTRKVEVQVQTDPSTRVGLRTEDFVTRRLVRISQASDKPMFVLPAYSLDSYLCNLTERKRGGSKNVSRKTKSSSEMVAPNRNTNDSENLQKDTAECETDLWEGCAETGKRKRKQVTEDDLQARFATLEERVKLTDPKGVFPSSADFEDRHFQRGEYDVLIISRQHGVIVFEIKTSRRTTHLSHPAADQKEISLAALPSEQTPKEEPSRSDSNEVKRGGNLLPSLPTASETGSRGIDTNRQLPTTQDDRINGELEPQDLDTTTGQGLQDTTTGQGLQDTTTGQGLQDTTTGQGPQDTTTGQGPQDTTTGQGPQDTTTGQGPQDTWPKMDQSEEEGMKSDAVADNDNDTLQADLRKTVSKALKQLKQSGLVLGYLTSDLPEKPPMTKILALPFISKSRLMETLQASPQLAKAMCQCLETSSLAEAMTRCLCADDVSEQPQEETVFADTSPDQEPEVEDLLQKWWTEMTSGIRQQSATLNEELSWDTYEQLISRFCGKHSRLRGHSVADCIHLTGVHFGRSILRQDQLDILQSNDNFVFLSGPPGSGKTLLLGLKAVEWAKAGDVVIIICPKGVNSGSLVSWLLHRRVVQALGGSAPAQPQTDTDRKGNGGRDPGGQKRTEESERSGLQAENEPVSKTRRKGRHRNKPAKEKAPSFAGNVHLEFISSETNVTDLVQTVMQRHGSSGRGVRFVVDEVQMEVTEESQFDRLSGGLHRLRQILELYQEIAEHLGQAGCEKEEETKEEQEEKKEKETKEQKEEETEKKNENREQENDREKEEQMREEAKKETKVETKYVKEEREGATKEKEEEKETQQLHAEAAEQHIQKDERQKPQKDESRKTQDESRKTQRSERQEARTRVQQQQIRGRNSRITREQSDDNDQNVRTKTTPSDQTKTTPSDQAKTILSDQAKTTPSDQAKTTPSDQAKTSSSDQAKTTPSDQTKTTQSEQKNGAPSDQAKTTPSDQAKTTSSDQAKTTPSDKAKTTPSDQTKTTPSEPKNGAPSEQPSGAPPVEEAQGGRAMELMGKMKQHLGHMSRRLQQLQPKPGGPNLMQSEQWQQLMATISIVHSDVATRRSQLQQQVAEGIERGRVDVAWVQERLERVDLYMLSAMGFFFHAFCFLLFFQSDQLFTTVQDMQNTHSSPATSMWISSIYPSYRPKGFVVKRLTQCLRCPPVVQEVMRSTVTAVKNPPECRYVGRGCYSDLPLPSDGPDVKWIDHRPHMTSSQENMTSSQEVMDCRQCGKELADYLLQDLRIGSGGGQDGLSMEDVMITGSLIIQSNCRFVQELLERGISTEHENQSLVSPPPYTGKALVIGGKTMQGLEAKIVVYLPVVRRISVIKNKLEPLRGTPEAIAQRMRHDPATRPQTTHHGKDGHGSQDTDVIHTQPSVSHGPKTQTEQSVAQQKNKPQTEQSVDRKRDEAQTEQCVDRHGDEPQTKQSVDRQTDGPQKDQSMDRKRDELQPEQCVDRHGDEPQTQQCVDQQKNKPQTQQCVDQQKNKPQAQQCVDQQKNKPQTEKSVDRRGDGKKPGEAGRVNISVRELNPSHKCDTDRGFRQGKGEATTHNASCVGRAEHRSGGRSLVLTEMDTGADQTLGAGEGAVPVVMDTGADQTLGADEGVVAMAVDTDADKLERLGGWNREYLWQVASRCLSHLVVFHV